MAVENTDFLILLTGHVIQALVGLHVTDLRIHNATSKCNHTLHNLFTHVCLDFSPNIVNHTCLFSEPSVCVGVCAYLSQGVIVPGDLGIRVDVLQVPAEWFTLKLLS